MANLTVTVSDEMADLLKSRVEAGIYPSMSDGVESGLRLLFDEDVESWLRTEAAAAFDEMKANPDNDLSLDELRNA